MAEGVETRVHAQSGDSLPRLVSIMRRLLGPDGCPWDREQTLESLRSYVIEEAHEVVDAIDEGSPEALREELGDLLMQIVFQSELARAQGWFGPDDVVAAICDKLERRHPHVFGDASVEGTAEVVERWEQIKRREKAGRGLLEGVPVALPALLRAQRVADKASKVGLDWPDAEGPRAKVTEELAELDAARVTGDRGAIEREFGDLLFACANLARKLELDAEAALRGTLQRFAERMSLAEGRARDDGTDLRDCAPEAVDRYWELAKRALRTD